MTLILTDTHFINLDHVESIAWHKDAAYVSFRSGKKEVMYDDAASDLRQRVERIVAGTGTCQAVVAEVTPYRSREEIADD